LTFGNDFFQSWEDDNIAQQIEHERTSPKASPTPKRIEKSEAKPSETSVSAAPSSSVIPVTVPKKEVAATPSKRLGEVTTTKTEDATKFEIAFPGLTLADLKLDLDTKKNALIVKADKEIEEKHEDEYGSRKSYKKISFSRYLPLETLPSASDIHADFADGSLHITVARKAVEAAPSVTPLTITSSQSSPSVSAPSVTPVPVETAPEASSSNSPAPEAASSSAPSSDSMEAQATVEDADEN
jgi:HSP20 family protein